MQVAIDFKLTDDDFSAIVDTAGYAIGYWADEAEFDEPELYSISCEEGSEVYELRKDDIETAIKRICEGKVKVGNDIRQDILSAIKEDDYGYVDAYAADVIIQVACFGEIIYG